MSILASLLVATPLAQTITVDDSGGADHVQIHQAVQAAAEGDTILVASGSYAGFAVDGKGLTIVADLGAVVDVLGSVAVVNIPQTSGVVLSGLRVQGSGGQPGLRLESCSGSVVIDAGLFIGEQAPDTPMPWDGAGGRVRACAAVSLIDCAFFGADAAKGVADQPGGVGLSSIDSGLHFADVYSHGGRGADAESTHPATHGGSGVELIGGQFVVQGSRLFGAPGGDGVVSAPSCAGADGGHALDSYASRVSHRATDFFPGAGGDGAVSGCGDGKDGRMIQLTGGTLLEMPGPSRAIDATPSPAREGEWIQLRFRATGGDLAVLAFSIEPGFGSVPGLDGLRLVGEPLRLLTLGVVPPGGSIETAFLAPDLGPGLQAFALHCQLLSANPAAALTVLGENDYLLILDDQL
ncbi:hypothetical protein [Engelhardtia mirabilis]|uniref:DUF1565 domain-containing protein n=1 Tax=Engelhardtia mirabilis TaxID=2528011 RepID=A0A518BRH1_9BACT|nr:hypothetical protein Pla133_46970 [Planctomycetes bacterium Pla133]QDV03903.1 hypothetical protein Pla86_46950 [Planctomycetes bacterium Pla86]